MLSSIFEKKNVLITAGENGKAIWSVQLSARPAGGPYNLKVSVQGASITLTDVLFGDVWLCSGQSNMVFVVSHVSESESLHTEIFVCRP